MPTHQHGEEEGDDEVLLEQVLQCRTRWSDAPCGYIKKPADLASQDDNCGSWQQMCSRLLQGGHLVHVQHRAAGTLQHQ
jgi:hypothetical protein